MLVKYINDAFNQCKLTWGFGVLDTRRDVQLTHSDPLVLYYVTCYNIAIAHLINNYGDVEGAKEKIFNFLLFDDNYDIKSQILEFWEELSLIKNVKYLLPVQKNIGWIKIAFSYAFFYLFNNDSYDEAIKDILKRGGDTNTNAAIVGGLLGARWGKKNINHKWIKKGIRFDNSRKDYTQLESCYDLEFLITDLFSKGKIRYTEIIAQSKI